MCYSSLFSVSNVVCVANFLSLYIIALLSSRFFIYVFGKTNFPSRVVKMNELYRVIDDVDNLQRSFHNVKGEEDH
jgi:hypothetical protein